MTIIKDRRNEPHHNKFGTDRERFRQRNINRIKAGIESKIAGDSLSDLGKGGVKIPIPKESTREPYLHHTSSVFGESVYPGDTLRRDDPLSLHSRYGSRETVFSGNMSYSAGDIIPTSGGGGSGGKGKGKGNGPEASDSDELSEDDFIWINEADLMSILFGGRQLPDMTKFHAQSAVRIESEHVGYTNKGPSNRLDMQRTNIKRKQKSMLLDKVAQRRVLENLTEQFNILAHGNTDIEELVYRGAPKEEFSASLRRSADAIGNHYTASDTTDLDLLQDNVASLKTRFRSSIHEESDRRISILESRLPEQFRARSRAQRFKEEHLTYEYDDDVPKPNAKAVMFCQMDVSASMDQEKKNVAKVFFWLLNRFLKENYEEVEIVFLSHTTVAKEVTEQEFFYGRETGGTKVSPVIQKTLDIIQERYPANQWNIYSAQASDGDNDTGDNAQVEKLMDVLMTIAQAHYYVEIPHSWGGAGRKSDMLQNYEKISSKYNGKLHTAGGLKTAIHAMEAFVSFFPTSGSKQPAPTFMPAAA